MTPKCTACNQPHPEWQHDSICADCWEASRNCLEACRRHWLVVLAVEMFEAEIVE